MPGQGRSALSARGPGSWTPRPHALVGLVSRLLVAQAGASAALGVGYNRRNMPSLVLTVVIALALCGLAGVVRSGSQATWLMSIGTESGLVAVGLFRFAYARYLGGTLLGLIALGTLLHPAVARVFTAAPRWSARSAGEHPLTPGTTPDAIPDVLREPAA